MKDTDSHQQLTFGHLKHLAPEDWQALSIFCADEGDYSSARLAAGFAAGALHRREGKSTELSREWVTASRRFGMVERGEIDASEWSDY